MGLDMYLIGKKYFWHSETPRMEDDFEVKEVEIRLGYWRKHPNLHGYIVEEFANGEDNCQEISLDATRIARIIKAVETNDLPHTQTAFSSVTARTMTAQKLNKSPCFRKP